MLAVWLLVAAILLLAAALVAVAWAILRVTSLPALTEQEIVERTAPVSTVQIVASPNHDADRNAH